MPPKVFYNNECMICNIEINHYKKKCNSIEWRGIFNIKNIKNEINITPKQLARRLHVKNNDELLIGVDAFIFIWSYIPRYKFLSKLLKIPVIYFFANIFYEIIAFLLYLKNYSQINKINL